jgi:DNA polymerase III epsilon subunit family exonuclease
MLPEGALLNWREAILVGMDTETTGLDVKNDRVFEIGIVTFENGAVTESWGELMDPTVELEDKIVETTGVCTADVEGKPLFGEIAPQIAARMNGRVVVGYNILGFDMPILTSEFERLKLPMPDCQVVDALVFARHFVKAGRHRLGDMARKYGVEMDTAHRATADAEATVKLLLAMADELPSDLDSLLRLQAQLEAAQRAKRAIWRKKGGSEGLIESGPDAALVQEDTVSLGPAYLYGDEMDPLKAYIEQYADLTAGR